MSLNILKKILLNLIILIIPITSQAQTDKSLPQIKKDKSSESSNLNQSYDINPLYSKINFEVDHLVFSSVIGEFKEFEGKFKFNPQNFSQTELNASAKTSSIDTGFSPRNEHLKSSDFFDASKYPLITFKSTSAEKTGEKTFDLKGYMTIKGKTKPVTFKVTYKGTFKTKDEIRTSFKATAKVNRNDFGLGFQMIVEKTPAIGDIITISITSEGIYKINDSKLI